MEYAAFIEEWAHCDNAVRPLVAKAHQRLASLLAARDQGLKKTDVSDFGGALVG